VNPLRFIILMGIVSLLGDVTYEGARSVLGAYLASLGVSALVVGVTVGLAEFVGYGLRLVSGYFVDKTGRYWAVTFLGYGLILAIPLLALTDDWRIVATLIVLERLGKGIRTPARDTILSFATKKVGRGFGFGLHEALDQIGAFLGPLIVFVVLYLGFGYKASFAVLFVPCVIMLAVLAIARLEVPNPQRFEEVETTKPAKIFWIYVLFVFLSVAGFVNFQILSYHYKVSNMLSDELIPIAYAVAMGVDAIFALIIGKIYDRIGLRSLLLSPILTMLIPFGFVSVFAIVFYGAVMGIQETVMRASVADLVGVKKRGTAYGIFNLAYGLAFFFGSSIAGFLYGISIEYLWIYIAIVELLSFVVLLKIIRTI